MIEVTETSTVHNVPASDPDFRVESQALEPVVLPRDFHFGRPSLARYTPKILCVNRFAVAAHWVCPLNRQRAVREGLAEQTAVVLGRFFDTSPTLRPVVAHGLVTPSAVNRPVRAAPRSAGASPRTAAAISRAKLRIIVLQNSRLFSKFGSSPLMLPPNQSAYSPTLPRQ